MLSKAEKEFAWGLVIDRVQRLDPKATIMLPGELFHQGSHLDYFWTFDYVTQADLYLAKLVCIQLWSSGIATIHTLDWTSVTIRGNLTVPELKALIKITEFNEQAEQIARNKEVNK